MSLKFSVLILVMLMVFTSGCQQQTSDTGGSVVANSAYMKHFGDPPQVSKGLGYARVGFFPRTENPQKVSAVPLYLFNNRDQLQQILRRWTSGETILPTDSRLFNPLTAEDHLEIHPLKNETLIINLTTPRKLIKTDLSGIALSLSETALQFSEIKKVRVLLNGEPLGFMPSGGFQHAPEKISAVDPPALIGITGVWEKGSAELEEILINFDRPVVVSTIKLTNSVGENIQGKYFRSVFNMAIVIHPLKAELYEEGSNIHAQWDVTDSLGRSNSGKRTLRLEKRIH
ncbi:MAG: GerMN domain-containing protein [Desulfuromusa sp.]|nr:GerMN domain-containing protein [Desulfuromusa sp.]